jgi:RNA polymerase sigma-70 factor, ECF subfamily
MDEESKCRITRQKRTKKKKPRINIICTGKFHVVSQNEAEILQNAIKGNETAFSTLVDIHQTHVYNLCYRMLGSPQEAEDAAQETFWRAYRNLKRYDASRSFITWLLSIAAHYCIDQQRRRHLPTIELDELLDMENFTPDPGPCPELDLSDKEDIEEIQRHLGCLNPNDRAILVLRYFHELSEEEICNALSISKSAVKSRLHRARLHMAEQLIAQKKRIKVEGKYNETQTI